MVNGQESVTKPDHTNTRCPRSTNLFCTLQNKEARSGAQPAQGNNPLGEWEITDWSYFLSLAERKPILQSGFSAFCFLQNLHHTLVEDIKRKINATRMERCRCGVYDLRHKEHDNWGLKCFSILYYWQLAAYWASYNLQKALVWIRCLTKTKADEHMNETPLHPPVAGTVMTPNYLRSPKISVSPYCDCSNSGNNKDECDKFTEFFTENTCLRKLPLRPAAVCLRFFDLFSIFCKSALFF